MITQEEFNSWPFFGVLSHLVDFYLISNEEPSKGQSKFTYSVKVKSAQIHQDLRVKKPFCQKVAILTKNQTFMKEKSDIRPWFAKADHSGSTGQLSKCSREHFFNPKTFPFKS